MNVLILQGSPRRKGNTETVCASIVDVLREGGAAVESLRLADMNIGGCIECFACQKVLDRPGCSRKDDMALVYDKVLAADAVILATPVFCWSMSAQMRLALDRFYAFGKFRTGDGESFPCLIEKKPFALVVTAAGGPFDGAELCVASFRAMAEYLRLGYRGEFVAAPVADAKSIAADAHLMERAAEFARGLLK